MVLIFGNSLYERQFGGKIQLQGLITIYNRYLLITIPPNITGCKEPSFSEYNNLGLTVMKFKKIKKKISKVFQNINLPL